MHCYELHLNNFKDDFLNIEIFLHAQIPDLQILSDHNKPYINGDIIIQLSDYVLSLMTGLVVQGQIIFVSLQWKLMITSNCLVTNILQNVIKTDVLSFSM